ncbi:hypothetical protein CCACVL1_18475 [Corchorus capsularis]|uniref:Uncharacterized protein n=1 Tax=Corchorus capsularis TaxID=210143 RepID=A0A1R3HL64_COCAP|nr:hypothetical protein CCACVL1_18475 [Corchorus capsularis]
MDDGWSEQKTDITPVEKECLSLLFCSRHDSTDS